MLIKGTKVDGVYSADPHKVMNATRYERLSYLDVLSRDLKVMDASAISLARENRIPILVFSLHNSGAFADVVQGRGLFTLIGEEKTAKLADSRRRIEASRERAGYQRSQAAHGWRH